MYHLKSLKSSLLIFSVILLFAACKNKNTTETRDIQLLTDSSAYMNSSNSDTAVISIQGITTEPSKSSVNLSSSQNNGSTSSSSANNSTDNTSSTTTGNQNNGMSMIANHNPGVVSP